MNISKENKKLFQKEGNIREYWVPSGVPEAKAGMNKEEAPKKKRKIEYKSITIQNKLNSWL